MKILETVSLLVYQVPMFYRHKYMYIIRNSVLLVDYRHIIKNRKVRL